MNVSATWTCLIARINIFDSLRQYSQETSRIDPRDVWLTLAAFGGLIGLLYLLSKLFPQNEKAVAINSPRRLFWSLCGAHGLSLSQRWLLWRISREYGLEDAATVFVEPELLDVEMLGGEFFGKAAAIKSLQERLFGGLGRDGV